MADRPPAKCIRRKLAVAALDWSRRDRIGDCSGFVVAAVHDEYPNEEDVWSLWEAMTQVERRELLERYATKLRLARLTRGGT